MDIERIREISAYWEQVRAQYTAFESGLPHPHPKYTYTKCPVQFTNPKAQARSLGPKSVGGCCKTYADVNQMFGDIKGDAIVQSGGDMALTMVLRIINDQVKIQKQMWPSLTV